MYPHIQKSPDGDASLVSDWQEGRVASFEELVLRHQVRMVNIALRMTGDYATACEVAEEAFVAAFREMDSFRGSTRFETWLTGMILSLCRERSRQQTDTPADERTARSTADDRIQQCLMDLPDELREMVVLRDIVGLSFPEVSGILRLREGSVKTRLMQARIAVTECLNRAGGES